MAPTGSVIDWLLASDPAIRWQVMRDLLDAPQAEWQAERARVETEGWGARLLSYQDEDGQWAGGAFAPAGYSEDDWRMHGQPWTTTCFSLQQLREFGLDPSTTRARRTVDLIGRNSRWEEGGQPFWAGEVEECINARTVTAGVYFGIDVSPIVQRLLGERQPDGGWNCERDYFRAASLATGTEPDPRLHDAIDHLRARQSDDGTWPLDWTLKGPVWFEMEEPGKPSRWITLRALRVLRWWDAAGDGHRPS